MNRFKWFIAGLLLAMTTGVMALNVNGELKVALLELLASDPVSQVEEGRIYYNTATKQAKIYNGSSWSGLGSGGGSGEINYIENYDFENGTTDGWSTYDDGAVSVPVDGTGAGSGILLNNINGVGSQEIRGRVLRVITSGASQGEGISYDFEIAPPDKNKLLKFEFEYKHESASGSGGEWGVYIYDVDNAVMLSPSLVDIPHSPPANDPSKMTVTFASTDSDNYRAIFHIAGVTFSDMLLDNIVVGPGSVVTGAAITSDEVFDSTGLWSGLSSYTEVEAVKWRSGNKLGVRIRASNVTSSGSIGFTLPDGLTVDASSPLIQGIISVDDSVESYIAYVSGGGLAFWGTGPLGSTHPLSSDTIQLDVLVSVAEWAGSGTVNLGAGKVEYASSTTGTWDAAATASDTVYGPYGSPISGALTADRDKVVRFSTPNQPTDRFVLELDETGNGYWVPIESRVGAVFWPSANFGWRIIPSNSTDVTVRFFQYAIPGTTYNSYTGAIDWNTHIGTSAKWRLVRNQSGVPVGFGIATDSDYGLVTYSDSTCDSTVNICSGTYTCTTSNDTGLSSASSCSQGQYMKVGNVVTYSTRISLDITDGTVLAGTDISLPITGASFTGAGQVSGTCGAVLPTGISSYTWYIQAQAPGSARVLTGRSDWTGTRDIACTMTYVLP